MSSCASFPFLPLSSHIISQVPFLHYLVSAFLPTYSRSSRFAHPRRFPVYNLFWNSSFRNSLHMSIPCELSFFVSIVVCVTCTISMIRSSVTLSSLDLPAAVRQKSIFVASKIPFVVSIIGHILQLYLIILFIGVLYISLLLVLFVSIPKYSVSTVMGFFPSRCHSSITVSKAVITLYNS